MTTVPVAGAARATALVPAPRPADRLDSAAWGAHQAALALDVAAAVLGRDLDRPLLVRDVSTVVFRVGDLAAKVHPPTVDTDRLSTVLAALDGCPATLRPVDGPVATPYGTVTLWPWCPPGARVGWPAIGRLLRAFHDQTAAVAGVPAWRPLSRLADQVAGLPAELADVLLAARDRLLLAAAGLPSDLGYGVIHGDVSAENVLRRSRRRTVFIDLDFVATGPREYDLVGAYLRRRDGELSAAAYDRFCAAYGADVAGWAGLPVVTAICALGGLTFQVWAARHRGVEVPGLAERVAAWA